MSPNFKIISKIFYDFLTNQSDVYEEMNEFDRLVWLNIKTNHVLWELEDLARMIEIGSEHVAAAKKEIDKNNQIRNDLIRKIDIEIVKQINISQDSQERTYSESPGMIIDRLAILFIKLYVIRGLLSIIEEDDLKKEYEEKEKIILKQIDYLGNFLDIYFVKLKNREVFFEIQQAVKIYNDSRIRKYIKIIKEKKL